MDIYGQIARSIRQIASNVGHTAVVFPAEIKSVEGETCSVAIEDLVLTDVRLKSVVNNETDHVLILPKVGSHVLVCDFSGGQYRDLVVLEYSEVEKLDVCIGQTTMVMEDGQVTMNGGENNGLVKIQELTDKLNSLVDWCKNHTHGQVVTAVAGQATATIGNSGTPTSPPSKFKKDDYEDTTITH